MSELELALAVCKETGIDLETVIVVLKTEQIFIREMLYANYEEKSVYKFN